MDFQNPTKIFEIIFYLLRTDYLFITKNILIAIPASQYAVLFCKYIRGIKLEQMFGFVEPHQRVPKLTSQ